MLRKISAIGRSAFSRIIWFGVLVLVGNMAGAIFFSSSLLKGQEITKEKLIPGKDFKVNVGEMEWIFNKSQEEKYGLFMYSDEAVAVLKRDNLFYWWITAVTADEGHSFRFSGPNLNSMKPDLTDEEGKILASLKPEPGSFDNGYVGISAVYYDEKSKKLYDWHHAEDHEFPEKISKANKRKEYGVEAFPYYVSIGADVSTDFGKTFKKLGQVITANVSKKDFEESVLKDPENYTPVDMGNPSVIRRSDYLYLYYHDVSSDGYFGISVAQLDLKNLDKVPQPWKKYNEGSFAEPGLGGRAEPLLVGVFAQVYYNKYLKQFLMVHGGMDDQKIHLSASNDGLNWSDEELKKPFTLVNSPSPSYNVYPSFMDDGEDPNVLDEEFWLYYGHARDITQEPIRLARRKIKIELVKTK